MERQAHVEQGWMQEEEAEAAEVAEECEWVDEGYKQ